MKLPRPKCYIPVMQMVGGKCGCPVCKEGGAVGYTPRGHWKSRKNRHGRSFGRMGKKSGKK